MSKDNLIIELRKRLKGPLDWLVPELEELFKFQGGVVGGEILRIGLNQKYQSGYAACVLHGPMRGTGDRASIPSAYFEVLQSFNGAKLFATNLFGMLEEESNQRRCLSLEAANTLWINGYSRLPANSFHFGVRTFSWTENIGYFYDESHRVYSARQSGEILKRWPSFEIGRAHV